MCIFLVLLCNQSTPYDMRISNWSSDVCSSDLPPDPAWDKATQDAFIPGNKPLLFTSVHEVWPGHFLNFLHSNRAESIFGKLFVGYAFAEGWAHYTEELLWEAGLGEGDVETHIGQLSNELLRDCRYISALVLPTQIGRAPGRERVCRSW